MRHGHEVRDQKRVAAPALRGYRYQLLYTVLRWLELEPGCSLVVEGNEDVDRLEVGVDGEPISIEEQIKYRSQRKCSASELRDVVLNFAQAFCYHRDRGMRFRGILTTNADVRRSRSAVGRWAAGCQPGHAELAKALRAAARKSERVVKACIGRVTEDQVVLSEFVDSVAWAISAPAPESIEAEIVDLLGRTVPGVPSDVVLNCLLSHILRLASNPSCEARILCALDRDVLFNDLAIGQLVQDFAPIGTDELVCLVADVADKNVVAATVLFRGRTRLEGMLAKAKTRATVSGRPLPISELLAHLDCVVYASVCARNTRRPLRACVVDVLKQAQWRWQFREIHCCSDKRYPLPSSKLKTLEIGNAGLRELLVFVAQSIRVCVDDDDVVPALGDRLRWVHVLKDDRFITAEDRNLGLLGVTAP